MSRAGWLWLMAGIAMVVGVALCARGSVLPSTPQGVIPGIGEIPAVDTQYFSRADGPVDFRFPLDHGPHNDFQTEWWYYTGNLAAADGRRFGYQLTFFRRALLPGQERIDRDSSWAAEQVYLAHFALSDIDSGIFFYDERLARGAAGLAGAEGEPEFQVWLEDWRVSQTGIGQYSLFARGNSFQIDLQLLEQKPLVFHGESGYSQKGADPGNASYYISMTRLAATGEVKTESGLFAVEGLSWMDHEYSTSALDDRQVGWDWFSLQLDDDSEIMVYTLRREDGSIDPFSSGTLIRPDGSTRTVKVDEFVIEANGSWQSPHSGAIYPAGWLLEIPSEGITLRIEPLLADQELRVSFIYWEGAVQASGTAGGRNITGFGYVELTGYAQSMQRRF